jgi:hypothetical protein
MANSFLNSSSANAIIDEINTTLNSYLKVNNGLLQLPGNVVTYGGDFNGATSTEIGYLEGTRTYIQDQIDVLKNEVESNDTSIQEQINTLQNDFTSITPLLAEKMSLSGEQNITGDITASSNDFKFMGAKPSEIAFLSGVSDNIQSQLNNKQAKGDYATNSDLNKKQDKGDYATNSDLDTKQDKGDYATQTQLTTLQSEITAEYEAADAVIESTVTAGYTAADAVITAAYGAAIAAASTSLQTQIALKANSSDLSSYATQTWVNTKFDTDLQKYVDNYTMTQYFNNQLSNLNFATESWVQSQGYLKDSDINMTYVKMSDLSNYITQTDLTTELSNANYLTPTTLPFQLTFLNLATQDYVTQSLTTALQAYVQGVSIEDLVNTQLSNYATQSWVQSQGYLKDSDISMIYVKWSTLPSYITQSDLTTQLSNANYLTSMNLPMYLLNYATLTQLSNYATQTWVTSQNYLTSLPTTADFSTLTIGGKNAATQSWVQSQNYLTSLPTSADFQSLTIKSSAVATTNQLSSYLPLTGGSLTGAVSANGGVTVTGGLTTDSLTVQSGGETDSGSLTVTGNITANGTITANGGLTVATGKSLTLNAPITMNTFVTPTATQIGYMMSATGTATSIATGTYYTVCSVALTAGVWSVAGNVTFTTVSGTNSSAAHTICSISTSTSPDPKVTTQYSAQGFSIGASGSGSYIRQQVSTLVNLTANTTYNLLCEATYSTSSPSLQFTNSSNLIAVRIA